MIKAKDKHLRHNLFNHNRPKTGTMSIRTGDGKTYCVKGNIDRWNTETSNELMNHTIDWGDVFRSLTNGTVDHIEDKLPLTDSEKIQILKGLRRELFVAYFIETPLFLIQGNSIGLCELYEDLKATVRYNWIPRGYWLRDAVPELYDQRTHQKGMFWFYDGDSNIKWWWERRKAINRAIKQIKLNIKNERKRTVA